MSTKHEEPNWVEKYNSSMPKPMPSLIEIGKKSYIDAEFAAERMEMMKAAYREMREALASIVKSDLCGEIYDDGSVVSSAKLQSAKQTLDKYPEL